MREGTLLGRNTVMIILNQDLVADICCEPLAYYIFLLICYKKNVPFSSTCNLLLYPSQFYAVVDVDLYLQFQLHTSSLKGLIQAYILLCCVRNYLVQMINVVVLMRTNHASKLLLLLLLRLLLLLWLLAAIAVIAAGQLVIPPMTAIKTQKLYVNNQPHPVIAGSDELLFPCCSTPRLYSTSVLLRER